MVILLNVFLRAAVVKALCLVGHFAIHIEKCLHSFHKIKSGPCHLLCVAAVGWNEKRGTAAIRGKYVRWMVCSVLFNVMPLLKWMMNEKQRRKKNSWKVSIDTCLALRNAYRMQCKRNKNWVALLTTMSMSRKSFFYRASVPYWMNGTKGVLNEGKKTIMCTKETNALHYNRIK